MKEKSIEILKGLQYPNGLFSASSLKVSTGYNKSWIRDNVYEALGMEAIDIKNAIKTYQALFDIFLKHEYKIEWAIMEKPEHGYQYIHARYCPQTLNEFWEDWGNKQNDAIGAFLFKVAQLTQNGEQVIRNRHDFRILQKLVLYLDSIEYWHDLDSGMWEENEEVHASSVGACLAALKKLSETSFTIQLIDGDFFNDLLNQKIIVDGTITKKVNIPTYLISKGQTALDILLPRESIEKEVDLSLLSLIYPYNIVSREQADMILKNVNEVLTREKGVIRYLDDKYYNENGEAEWTMGFPWLAIIYKQLGDDEKYRHFMKKTIGCMNQDGELPELYYAHSDKFNENTPLGWSQALFIVASTYDSNLKQ